MCSDSAATSLGGTCSPDAARYERGLGLGPCDSVRCDVLGYLQAESLPLNLEFREALLAHQIDQFF